MKQGKGKRRRWRYGMVEIAKACGVPVSRVRMHRSEGFDPGDLGKMAEYVVAMRIGWRKK